MIRKKTFITVFSISFLFNIVFFLFAFVQKNAADLATEHAIEIRVIAEEQAELAETNATLAESEYNRLKEECETRLLQANK